MRVAITGGTGTLGRNLISKLKDKGYWIRCMVRERSERSFILKYCDELIIGDLTKLETLVPFISGVTQCFHLAAQVSDTVSKDLFEAVNVEGAKNIVDTILSVNPMCKLIYASSISALNVDKNNFRKSTMYAISKFKADQIVWDYIKHKNLIATIIYAGLIYGPHDLRLVPSIIKYLKSGRLFYIKGGETLAPLIYVDDLCNLFIKVSEEDRTNGNSYISVRGLDIGMHDFINMLADRVGCPRPRYTLPKKSLMSMAVFLEEIFNIFRIKRNPPLTRRTVDLLSLRWTLDNSKAWEDMGWEPKIGVNQGLDQTFNWYKENGIIF
ncbi:MAG: NAD-dependent epimerase/dehydratase family protein [Nitrospinae bacterium]|nr:NAD-dependent epimerase/dehydratase family protein [Nitrospinota bacterium]MBI3815337.1 NAD-dependent epimerase/dehydratase family protein [Nitrospinota bacterium]